MKACALVGEYPAVYDFTARHDYRTGRIAERAIFHLHGQHTGFVILNTQKEVDEQAIRVKPVIGDTNQNRTWIIVGYSGNNDPVFQEILNLDSYDHGLYWVGFNNEPIPFGVRKLLERDNTYLIQGYDADRFFVELCRKLKCFPPPIVGRPFSHLSDILQTFTDLPPFSTSSRDILESARTLVSRAISQFESIPGGASPSVESIRLKASDLLARGDFLAVRELITEFGQQDEELKDLEAWSYVMEANGFILRSRRPSGWT
jgi:hypothetical protein